MNKRLLTGGHKAKKRFGQNFLVDRGIISHIVRSIAPKSTDNLIEIGPGQGAITALLLESCKKLQVIELDRDLIPLLLAQFASYEEFKIHQADALDFDFRQFYSEEKPLLRIVGNLPYNISTPLIFHLLAQRDCIADMHFMLQKEVVQRLAAMPGNKNYGRLSIMSQYYCAVEHLFDVPPESFHPAPKVDSAIVRLTPYKTPQIEVKDINTLEKLVKAAFSQRRKTLRNALKSIMEDEIMEQCNADFSKRAEELTLTEYAELSNFLFATQQN